MPITVRYDVPAALAGGAAYETGSSLQRAKRIAEQEERAYRERQAAIQRSQQLQDRADERKYLEQQQKAQTEAARRNRFDEMEYSALLSGAAREEEAKQRMAELEMQREMNQEAKKAQLEWQTSEKLNQMLMTPMVLPRLASEDTKLEQMINAIEATDGYEQIPALMKQKKALLMKRISLREGQDMALKEQARQEDLRLKQEAARSLEENRAAMLQQRDFDRQAKEEEFRQKKELQEREVKIKEEAEARKAEAEAAKADAEALRNYNKAMLEWQKAKLKAITEGATDSLSKIEEAKPVRPEPTAKQPAAGPAETTSLLANPMAYGAKPYIPPPRQADPTELAFRATVSKLQQTLGRTPTEEEVAAVMAKAADRENKLDMIMSDINKKD